MGEANRQLKIPFLKAGSRRLDVAARESWLWDAACQIRGPLDAPDVKDYILPLVFLKSSGTANPPAHKPIGRGMRLAVLSGHSSATGRSSRTTTKCSPASTRSGSASGLC